MEDKGFWDNKAEEKLQAELKADCDAQVKEFESQPDFPRDVSFEHVFGTEHAVISEQKVEFDQELEEENDA
jgi:TPP-dependent pyruvate/acetoin dehydrogenase alpha subunit